MLRVCDQPPNRWRYTFLRPHIEVMRDRHTNPVVQRSVLFRAFPELDLEQFFFSGGGSRGEPWYIEGDVRVTLPGQRARMMTVSQLAEELAVQPHPVALMGAPGAGKTTLQLRLLLSCLMPGNPLHDAGLTPVQSLTPTGLTLADAVRAAPGLTGDAAFQVADHLRWADRLLFLLDLNILRDDDQMAFLQALRHEVLQGGEFRNRGHRLVLAARYRPDLQDMLSADGYAVWLLETLPPEGVQEFFEAVVTRHEIPHFRAGFITDLLHRHEALFCNPQHLSLVTYLLTRDTDALQGLDTEGALFKVVADQILRTELPAWGPLDATVMPTSRAVWDAALHPVEHLLARLADRMTTRGVSSMSLYDELPRLLEELHDANPDARWWPRRGGVPLPPTEVGSLLSRHSLLTLQGDHVTFLHDVFRDFYASKSIAYDPDTGELRTRRAPSASESSPPLAFLEPYQQDARWWPALRLFTDLVRRDLLTEWVLTWARRWIARAGDGAADLPSDGSHQNQYMMRFGVEFLLRLGETHLLIDLIQPPYLNGKAAAGHPPEALVTDVLHRLATVCAKPEPWHEDTATHFAQTLVWAAATAMHAFESAFGGGFLRDYLDGRVSFVETRARIDNNPSISLRFYFLLLLAEICVDRHRTDLAERLVADALALPFSPDRDLRDGRWEGLEETLVDYWTRLNLAPIDPHLFAQFTGAFGLNRRAQQDILIGIAASGQPDRALSLAQHQIGEDGAPAGYLRFYRHMVIHHCRQGQFERALHLATEAAPVHTDSLIGEIVTVAIEDEDMTMAAEMVDLMEATPRRDYLQQRIRQTQLRGHRSGLPLAEDRNGTRRLALAPGPQDSADLPPEWSPRESAQAHVFIQRRADFRRLAGPPESRTGQGLREGPSGHEPMVASWDEAAWRARWAGLWLATGATQIAHDQAQQGARLLQPHRLSPRGIPAIVLLARYYRDVDDRHALRSLLRETLATDAVGRERPRAEYILGLLEELSYWGLWEEAAADAQPHLKEHWGQHGRFLAHHARVLLSQTSPDRAFAWFASLPSPSRADARWEIWHDAMHQLAAIWQTRNQLSGPQADRQLMAWRESVLDSQPFRDSRRPEYSLFYKSQILANLVFLCWHHPPWRPIVTAELDVIPTPPIRAYCLGQLLLREDLAEQIAPRVAGILGDFDHFDDAFFSGKARVARNWAEALSGWRTSPLTPSWWHDWVRRMSTDSRLVRILWPDLAWQVSRHMTRANRELWLDDSVQLWHSSRDYFSFLKT